MTSDLVADLGALDSPAQAGGKAWSLHRMAAEGLPVPSGFSVTTATFDRFARDLGLERVLDDERLDLERPETFDDVAGEVRDRVLAARIPVQLREALGARFDPALGPFVVRSSAVGEDSATASFAGQLDSVLEVRTREELERAVLSCWASYWSARSLYYQRARSTPLRGMGVVVQRQVEPIRGGALFTKAPDDADRILVEWVDGHPKTLVDGSKTPEQVRIDRSRPDHPIYGDLARRALDLERAWGRPQDIEWVVDAREQLWFVQSRPITTARPKTLVWSNVNVNENYPAPITPLLYSIARDAYEHYFRNLGHALGVSGDVLVELDDPLRHAVGVHGARLYYNLTNLHEAMGRAPLGGWLSRAFDGFVGRDDEGRAQRIPASSSEPHRTGREPDLSRRDLLAIVRSLGASAFSLATLGRRVRRFEARVDAYAAATEDVSDATLPELHARFRGFLHLRFRQWQDASLADLAATVAFAGLKAVLRRSMGGAEAEALPQTLLQAIPDVVSAGPVEGLWALSRRVRGDAALARAFETETGDALLMRIRSDFPHCASHFDAWIRDWGFRVSGELMLTVPNHSEDPASALELLRGFVDLEGPSPEEATRLQAQRRDAVLADLRRRLGRRRFAPISLALEATRAGIRARERVRLKQALLYSRFRGVLLAIGDRLVSERRLADRDDVFFLTWRELDDWLAGSAMFPGSMRGLVELRRAEHARLSATRPPDTVELPEGAYFTPRPEADATDDATTLTGVGVSGGTVSAPARVVASPSDRRAFCRGEILVAEQADPGWAPLFFLASGLVLERGGMLSHGAIVAREFGIPGVIGVRDATKRIRTGEAVVVDGDTGSVARIGGTVTADGDLGADARSAHP